MAAVAAAATPAVPERTTLAAATERLNVAFHRLVQSFSAARRVDNDPTAEALSVMAKGCRDALAPVAFRLGGLGDDAAVLAVVGHELARTEDPVILALLGAGRASHGADLAEERLAAAFAMVRWLEQWANAAASAFVAGSKAAAQARRFELKQQSFMFGKEVFEAYQALTGQIVRYSRASPLQPNEGDPTGPLIRFTATIYERLRARCSNVPDLARLATRKALNPKTETFADWCDRYNGSR